MKKIGLIGFGSIGKYLFDHLKNDAVEIVFIYVRKVLKEADCAHLMTTSLAEVERLCRQGVDLVVEAATPEVVAQLAPSILQHSDMAVFSSTALADEGFEQAIRAVCQASGHHLYLPHGAVMGIDGIMDARAVLREVSITTTKTPQSLGRTDAVKTVVYDGSTRGACKLFPRNVNVHACTALAGLGFDQTTSKIISDPAAPANMHTIEVKADGCQFSVQTMSPSLGGVSSTYTPVSACASVRRILFKQGIVLI